MTWSVFKEVSDPAEVSLDYENSNVPPKELDVPRRRRRCSSTVLAAPS